MRYNTILVQLLFLSEGLPGVVFGQSHTVTEGEDITVECWFQWSGRTKVFCKKDCDEKRNILVETTRNQAENGRYSIQFDEKTFIMTVRIKKVMCSDSRQYECKLKRYWFDSWMFIDGKHTFEIEVIKARSPVKPPDLRVPPVIPPTTAVRPTHSPDPSPGPVDPEPSPGPGLDSGTTVRPEKEKSVTPHGSTQTGSLLYVGVTLAVILTLFSVALLIFYCKKKENAKEVQVNTEFGEVQEGDREYEEVQSRFDSASAPAHTQVDHVLYSEVNFSENSALHSRAEEVLYSAVRAQDNPLYSTISAPQP